MFAAESPPKEAKAQVLSKIIKAAELEFSERGFDGTGMKVIATRAGVSQSLLHYHYGSKDKLYAAVIQTRSSLINTQRLNLLSAVDLAGEDGLENVFRALFLPALGPSGGGRAYARIFAGLIAGNVRDQALVKDHYDDTAKIFIAAIQTCLPGIEPKAASRIYLSALGVLATSLARDGRAARLVETPEAEDDDDLIKTLTRFAVGGAKAIQNG